MCLSIAIHRPDDVLASGVHLGYEWTVVHNGRGYRCGYIRVPAGHPWHGIDFAGGEGDDHPSVYGGVTFSEPDMPCDKGGADDAYWQGFDCCHYLDEPDPEILAKQGKVKDFSFARGVVRSQAFVEAECRRLIEQAAEVAAAAGFVLPDEDHGHGVACGVEVGEGGNS